MENIDRYNFNKTTINDIITMKLFIARFLLWIYLSLVWIFLLSSAETEYNFAENWFEVTNVRVVIITLYILPLMFTYILLTKWFVTKIPNEMLMFSVLAIVFLVILFWISEIIFFPSRNFMAAAVFSSLGSFLIAKFISNNFTSDTRIKV